MAAIPQGLRHPCLSLGAFDLQEGEAHLEYPTHGSCFGGREAGREGERLRCEGDTSIVPKAGDQTAPEVRGPELVKIISLNHAPSVGIYRRRRFSEPIRAFSKPTPLPTASKVVSHLSKLGGPSLCLAQESGLTHFLKGRTRTLCQVGVVVAVSESLGCPLPAP